MMCKHCGKVEITEQVKYKGELLDACDVGCASGVYAWQNIERILTEKKPFAPLFDDFAYRLQNGDVEREAADAEPAIVPQENPEIVFEGPVAQVSF